MHSKLVPEALIIFSVLSTTFASIVQTHNGPVKGEKRGSYYAFEGIPYAKAPTGMFRLAATELNDVHWEDPLNATKPGPMCLQWNRVEDKTYGEEDCLFMNIYTTSLDSSEPLQTILLIHGGAFMFSSGDYYQPDHLLKRPMILVSFNYRLGTLGFLSTEDDVIPGNFGLKDQAVALQWIRKNIASFGGHPDQITLAGVSAGSASIHLHYLSPLSKGLFKNGIGHSGSALNPWVLTENSAEKAKQIARSLGCATMSSSEILQCLQQKSARDIVRAVGPLYKFLYNPFTPVGVVVEKRSAKNPNPFLTDHPYNLMSSGQFNQVPLLLTVNNDEGLYPAAEFISKEEYLQEIDSNWNRLLPIILDYETSLRNDEDRRNEISELIRDRYLGKNKLDEGSFQSFVKMASNRLYLAGVITSARLMQSYSPVYLYNNCFKIKYGPGEFFSNSTKNYGVAHGEDAMLIYKMALRDAIPYTEEELLVGSKLVEMYEDFARDGVARYGDLGIPRMDRDDVVQYLELNHPESVIRVERQLDDEDFWNQLDFNDGMPVVERDGGRDEL